MLDKKWKYTTKETMADIIEAQQKVITERADSPVIVVKEEKEFDFSPGSVNGVTNTSYKEESCEASIWWLIAPMLIMFSLGLLVGKVL